MWARAVNPVLAVPYGAAGAVVSPLRQDLLQPFEADYGADLLGSTIMRVRGIAGISSLDGTAVNDSVLVQLTMFIGTENQILRGPDANDSSFSAVSNEIDYFAFEPFHVRNSATRLITGDVQSRLIDVKSHRKLQELNQSLVLDIAAAASSVAVGTVSFFFDFSVLVALP